MLAFWFHLNLQRSEKLILRTDDFTFSFLLATFENFLVVIKEYFLVDNFGKGLFGWATATGQRENEAILTNYPWVSEDGQ